MDKIYITIISILVIIIISLSIYILIKSGIYKNMITDLKEENKNLQTQISSAEALIDFQNTKINSFAVDVKKAEEKYKQDISNINEKYNIMQKKYESMEKKECENILQIIDENQRRFINEREN